jgi:hypothetical protein
MREPEAALESEALWRRVGLAELRKTLEQVTRSLQRLQQGIQGLPPCDACARAQLLQELHAASRQLSKDTVGISVLTEALRAAVTAAEQAQAELAAQTPPPCRCPTGPCTCHE